MTKSSKVTGFAEGAAVEEHVEALHEGFGNQAEVAAAAREVVPTPEERKAAKLDAAARLRGQYEEILAGTGYGTIPHQVASKVSVEALQIVAERDASVLDAAEGLLFAAAAFAAQVGVPAALFLVAAATAAESVYGEDSGISIETLPAPETGKVDRSKLN